MARLTHDALRLVSPIMDPLRLRVLLILEEQPATATQLARSLGEPYDKVNWALKQLAKGGLAELRSVEPAASGMVMQKVYGVRHRGWARLLPVLEAIVVSEVKPDDG